MPNLQPFRLRFRTGLRGVNEDSLEPPLCAFFLGVAFAALGLGLSVLFVRETQGHARLEASNSGRIDEHAGSGPSPPAPHGGTRHWAVSQAGLVNNAVDGRAWGILPLLFAANGESLKAIGVLAALYPGVRCVAQLFTGA